MTLNELIKELQDLQSLGAGDFQVSICDSVDDNFNTIFTKVTSVSAWFSEVTSNTPVGIKGNSVVIWG